MALPPSLSTYSAANVVAAYLDLLALSPNPHKWPTLTAAHDAPRYYRFRQLAAMFRAFELPLDFIDFPSGNFLDERDPASYRFLSDAVAEFAGRSDRPEKGHFSGLNPPCVVFVFSTFFQLLLAVRQFQNFNSGYLEAAPVAVRYAIAATEAVVSSLPAPPLAIIQTTLSRLIDPLQRSFSRYELVTCFEFPDVDLLDIDIDWM